MKFNNRTKSYYKLFIYVFCVFIISCKSDNKQAHNKNEIAYFSNAPIIDGEADELWNNIDWSPIDQVWLGSDLSAEDFEGKYKLAWNEEAIYVLAQIHDDILVDFNSNPLDKYWDDDCLEVFVDVDASGGNHQYNHNAFAYHISLAQEAVDIGPDSIAHFYKENVTSAMKQLKENEYLWEVKLNMFNDKFMDGAKNQKVKLLESQALGFAIAYCDNDNSKEREHFIGSAVVNGVDKNRGWIDAGIFEKYILKK